MSNPNDEITGTVNTLEERFFQFLSKDFPNFREENAAKFRGLEDSVEGIDTRLRNIEGSGRIVMDRKNGDKKLNWSRLKEIVAFALVLGAVLLSGFSVYFTDPAEIENKTERVEAAVEAAEGQLEAAVDLAERVDDLIDRIKEESPR